MLVITKDSHLDHALTTAQLAWLLQQFGDRDAFFIETVELPEELGTVPCGLYGPAMGDAPVKQSEVYGMLARGNRQWESRMVDRPMRQTSKLTVIAGPHEDQQCVLYTAFGGPAAPREVGDLNIASDEEAEKSADFWSQHALSLGAM